MRKPALMLAALALASTALTACGDSGDDSEGGKKSGGSSIFGGGSGDDSAGSSGGSTESGDDPTTLPTGDPIESGVSEADFCSTLRDEVGSLVRSVADESQALPAMQDFADTMRDLGTPEAMPSEAKSEWEAGLAAIGDLEESDMSGSSPLDALADDNLTEYLDSTCGDMLGGGDSTDLPTEYPTDLPTDYPTDLPTDFPSEFSTEDLDELEQELKELQESAEALLE